MTEAHVGRLLVAALHQAITDELPTRIDFYEHWLRGERVRDGGVGLAPMTAVLGFLRAEGAPYHLVMARAGRYAAEWTRDAMPTVRRRTLQALPRWWRARAVLRLAARAIRAGYPPSRATVNVRRGQARVEIASSLFCRVREAQTTPQCDFHAALINGLMATFNLPAVSHIETCTGRGDAICTVALDLTATAPVQEVAA
jgi:hypothetical protein